MKSPEFAESPTLAQLKEEWNALDDATREELYQEFEHACISSSCDASGLYFYPLLIVDAIQNYIND